MESKDALVVFQGRDVRRTWHNDEWYFSIIDVIYALIDSADPSDYLKKMKKRDEFLAKGWGQIVTPLRINTPGGPQLLNCANTESMLRIIQSIPSRKAEPFKKWLARVGYERIKEIEDPELAQQRMIKLYRLKGYSKEWIEKRLRGIAVRKELTGEWGQRGVDENIEYAILTNDISKATFGKTIEEYKQYKKLSNENLRDHMNDMELIFTMLGEKVTSKITQKEDSQGFGECQKSAKRGGKVASVARSDAENEIGESIVSDENYLEEVEKKKRKRIK